MANCDTQYGALLVELIQTAVFRSYDLVGKWHCFNRSYFAPVFDHFNLDTSKASKHCSATVLVSSEPFENDSVGINADYSFAFNANCFLKNAKLYRAAKRKSGTRFTHDARWLMFESVLGEWREKQSVKAGDHFIPNLDLLDGLEGVKGVEGMNADTVRRHWKTITGERKVGDTRTFRIGRSNQSRSMEFIWTMPPTRHVFRRTSTEGIKLRQPMSKPHCRYTISQNGARERKGRR